MIEAICPTCGPVVCPPGAFELRLCSYAPASHYTFACPSCSEQIQRPATARVTQVLLAQGVRMRSWDPPGELLEEHPGGPLSVLDVIELRRSMDDPGWIDHLARG